MTGQSLTTLEKGTAVRLSVRSGVPVLDTQGNIVGIVSTGFRLDIEQYTDQLKQLTACETSVFLGDEMISTTVLKEDGTRATGTKEETGISDTVLAGTPYSGHADILGRSVFACYTPIAGSDGQVLGMLFSGQYLDETTATIWSFVQSGLIIMLVLLAASIAIILLITRRIVAPIRIMTAAASALTSGDTEIEIQVNTKDEMRTLADAFTSMIANTRQQVQIIEHIADGDLTVCVEARSEKDVMNNALISMLELNNDVFSNIASSARQVAVGSEQIANSSQALAQGATEQASTIQELSNTMSAIAEETKATANMADEAATFAGTIKSNAEKGSRQMDAMIGAVKEINASSQNISRVIKVIDDIAFQTNILALNAAVEAARAGQHGKGFAVVAEEVRNLASKSAEAARDTSSMIQDSMEKAELGSQIANETSLSLAEIISGISESNQLIAEIARSSQEQSVNISQVNAGVDQVAQVVQQNSATAQENAAASQEMSSQSSILRELVAKFKIKGDTGTQLDMQMITSRQKTDFVQPDSTAGFGKY
jgi:methyl-accepting chemotaxis protein